MNKFFVFLISLLSFGKPASATLDGNIVFHDISRADKKIIEAHAMAGSNINYFESLVEAKGTKLFMAKLRFRAPEPSDSSNEDHFLYLWLTNVWFDREKKLFFGTFFEVPEQLENWHKVGEELGFHSEDIFDWMVNDDGHLIGGYSIRVHRKRLVNDTEKQDYDNYIGVTSYEPLKTQ